MLFVICYAILDEEYVKSSILIAFQYERIRVHLVLKSVNVYSHFTYTVYRIVSAKCVQFRPRKSNCEQ